MTRNLFLFVAVLFQIQFCLQAQTTVDTLQKHKQLYENAYNEMTKMLEGKKSISFKKAVFLMENAYLNNTWTYERFNQQISSVANKLRQLIKERQLEQFKTAGNWAVFTYMKDSIQQNNFNPYTYDFDNFMPDKDPSICFVTKLLTTNKGNCVSLPFLYKILVEEIGASASLALAPLHCYIKHKDEKGKWVNLEMTNGSFSRDEWIMQETGITAEQIKTGIYMNALSEKESIAIVMEDLAHNYRFQFGNSSFDLKACETGLKYFPNSVNLLSTKFEHYRIILLQSRKDNNKALEDQTNKILYLIDQKLIALAYKQPSTEGYANWVKENEAGKQAAGKQKIN
jgi:hypothetical protein